METRNEYDVTTRGYKTVTNGGYERLTVERKKDGMAKGFGKFIALSMGILVASIGLLLCVTIIGALPGFFILLGSLPWFYASLGKQAVKCPSCKKKNVITKRQESFGCTKCKTHIVVDWS